MAEETQQQQQQAQEPEKLTLTQEELDAKINSEYDRRFQKQQEKFNQQLEEVKNKALEDGKSEGQKLAKMSAQEKADAEAQKRLDDLKAREDELNQRELTANVVDVLAEKGLPKELAGSLVGLGDADKISNVVETIQKSIEQGINEGVNERMRQDPPTNGSSNLDATDDPFTKVLNQYK